MFTKEHCAQRTITMIDSGNVVRGCRDIGCDKSRERAYLSPDDSDYCLLFLILPCPFIVWLSRLDPDESLSPRTRIIDVDADESAGNKRERSGVVALRPAGLGSQRKNSRPPHDQCSLACYCSRWRRISPFHHIHTSFVQSIPSSVDWICVMVLKHPCLCGTHLCPNSLDFSYIDMIQKFHGACTVDPWSFSRVNDQLGANQNEKHHGICGIWCARFLFVFMKTKILEKIKVNLVQLPARKPTTVRVQHC